MNKRRVSFVAALAFIVFVAAVLYYSLQQDKTLNTSQTINQAPDFQLPWVDPSHFLRAKLGKKLSLEKLLTKKPVVLNFWASWCQVCRQEAAELEKFWQKYQKILTVVGIASHDHFSAARNFAKKWGKTYPLALDKEGLVAVDYGVTGFPETFLIDRQGRVVHRIFGEVTEKDLEALLPLLQGFPNGSD